MAKASTYRLHKASGQGVTTIQGKVHYFGPFKDPASKRKFHALLAELDQYPVSRTESKSFTMAQIAIAYLDHAEGYYSESEFEGLKSALSPINEIYADYQGTAFSPVEFKACRAWWLKRGVSRQYINKQAKRLLRILKWATGEGMFPSSVFQSIECIAPLKRGRTEAKEASPIAPVAQSVVDATLPHLPPVVADMIRFQLLVACRPGEVCKLKPSMVDRTSKVWEINLEEHKTAHHGKTRTIYVGKDAQKILEPYLKRKPDSFCFSPIEATEQRKRSRHATRVTPLHYGNRPGSNVQALPLKELSDHYTTHSYGRAIKYACLRAFPVPKSLDRSKAKEWRRRHSWSPNQLRHTALTRIRRDHGLEVAAIIAGHSQIQTTQIYAESNKAKAIEIVGGLA